MLALCCAVLGLCGAVLYSELMLRMWQGCRYKNDAALSKSLTIIVQTMECVLACGAKRLQKYVNIA